MSGTINSGGMTKTKSSWTEILIRSIPKLLVWIIAIGISAPVLIKARVTHISNDHLTCSVQWDLANSTKSKEHEQRFSDLCDKKLTTVRHHSDFIKQTHGTKWFETKLETCLDKVIENTSFGNSSFEPQDKLWRVCRDTKMSNSQRYYWSAVYLIGSMLPLLATLISYSGLFRYTRKSDVIHISQKGFQSDDVICNI